MKVIKKFKLKGYNEDEWFWVYVYDSLKKMREDASKFSDENIEDALGVVQPYRRIKINADKTEKLLDNIGIIRLVADRLQTHIIAHELIHAAIHHYRLTQNNGEANFGDSNSDKEEDFGMIYAKYFSKMTRQLYRFGLWK